MKKILIYTLIFMLPFALYAQDSTAVTQTVELPVSKSVLQGDSAYAKADYATAIAVYEAILAEGNEAASLYYNLGNAYFKSDEIAKAILNYERALLLDPSDKDIRFNLEFARSKTVDKVTEGYTIFFVRWIEELINTMSMDAWCILGITAFVLLLVSLLFFLFNRNMPVRKSGFAIAIISLFVTIFANIAAYSHYDKIANGTDAIIIVPSVTAKSTPDESGTSLFVIHEGRKVKITDDTMSAWKEVELEDGTIGWLPANSLERI